MKLLTLLGLSSLLAAIQSTQSDSIHFSNDLLCIQRDPKTNFCTKCFTGYYVDASKRCKQNPPLCRQTDKYGHCTKCFKNFALINGQCFFRNQMEQRSQQSQKQDPLCDVWRDGRCEQCMAGSYMNKKGKCKIADPNCLRFNKYTEKCELCLRGYDNIKGVCQRKC